MAYPWLNNIDYQSNTMKLTALFL